MSIDLQHIISGFLKLSENEQEEIATIIKSKTQHHKKRNNQFSEKIIMSSLFKFLIGKYGKAVLTETKNGLFLVDPEDYGVGYDLRSRGIYGENEIPIIKKYLTANDKALIIGAHIGALAIPLSKYCQAVTAIEANPYTFGLLKTNLLLNKIFNCTAINIAANDKFEEISFLANRVNSGGSKRKPLTADYMYSYDNPPEILVNAVSLDDFLEEKKFDVIVMDIEGSEYFALKGMQELLKNTKALIVEFIPHHLKNVSGISVDDFLSTVTAFEFLTIPSKGIKVSKKDFSQVLNYMYECGENDDGIIFDKR